MIVSVLAQGISAAAAAPSEGTMLDRTTLIVADIGIVLTVAGILLCVLRLRRGPHLADRAAAVDSITVQLVGLVLLFTLRGKTLSFFDGALALSLMGFVATVAMGQFLIRRRLRELDVREELATGDIASAGKEKGTP